MRSQYNLKRKITSLPPLSSEIFAEKVHAAQASSRAERERAAFEKSCSSCNKTYFSENAYTNHVQSAKHRSNVATLQLATLRAGGSLGGMPTAKAGKTASNGEEVDETESTFSLGEPVADETAPKVENGDVAKEIVEKVNDMHIDTPAVTADVPMNGTAPQENGAETKEGDTALPLEACLFCPYVSPSLALNMSHMTKAHGLFIPEVSYLVDLEGLITYLGKKLVLGNQCLYCSKTKGGLEGIRTHMRDKGHCMLGFETDEQQVELGQYYDFRSTYSDDYDTDDSAVPMKHTRKPHDADDQGWEDAEGEAEGWETDSDASSLDSTELTAVPIDHAGSGAHKRHSSHHQADGWHSHAHTRIYHDDYELHLPSGRSVGHRSLARYYKQNLRDREVASEHEVRMIQETANDEDDDEDTEEGGVEVPNGNGEVALNRRERREANRQALAKRGNDSLGMVGVTAAKRGEVRKLEKKARDVENRGRRQFEWGNNKRGNHQQHFRDPLLV